MQIVAARSGHGGVTSDLLDNEHGGEQELACNIEKEVPSMEQGRKYQVQLSR
jgi:hypothetical protein